MSSLPGTRSPLGSWRGARWDVPGVVLFVAVGLAYAVGSKLALELARATDLQSVFFIPAGITIAAMLRLPRRQWWIVLLAAATAELVLDVTDGYALDASLGFVLANVVEPLVGALIVGAYCRTPIDLARRRDVIVFVVGAVLIAPFVGGFVGALSDALFDDSFWPTWWEWALGDAVGVVVIGSSILVWGSSPDRRPLLSIEGAVLVVGSAVVTGIAFASTELPIMFVVVVGIVVAGVVFGARAVAMSALAVSVGVALGLLLGSGAVTAGVADSTALVLLKAQLGLFTVAGLLVAAEASEAQRASRQAAELENAARFHGTFENAGVGMAHIAPDGRWLRVNSRLCDILGYRREDLLATTYHTIAEPEDLLTDAETARQLIAGEISDSVVEKRCVRADGSRVWTSITTSVVGDAAGRPEYFIAVVEDVSARKAAEDALRDREADERRRRERAELLAEMIEQLEAVSGREARARRLAEMLVPRVADYVSIEAPGEDAPVLAIRHRDPELDALVRDFRTNHRLRPDHAQSMHRAASGVEQLVSVVTPELRASYAVDAEMARVLERVGTRSHMAVPIDLGGDVPGALLLGRTDPQRPGFTEGDLAFMRDVARRAGIVLAAAWLREEEHRASVRLQRTLLPEGTLDRTDVEVASRYEAGSDNLEVGGDWFDVIERDDGQIVVAVGDVVGHGLEAAATMGRLRAAFAAYTAHRDRPADLLADLDRFAHGPGDAEFTTVWCAVLDPFTGELHYASAGHPPALVVGADGRARWLDDGRSVPLRTVPVESRPEGHASLDEGDLLVLYSDGLVERRDEALASGLDRLARATAALRDEPVGDICDGLVATLASDAPRHDDSVVLVLRYAPITSRRLHCEVAARPEELAVIRASLRAWLAEQEADPATVNDVLLGVGEACANAVEHAYAGGPVGTVEVDVVHDGRGEYRVRVRDHGSWRPGAQTSDGTRGRGTPIMRAIGAGFVRHTGPAGTTVNLHVRSRPARAAHEGGATP